MLLLKFIHALILGTWAVFFWAFIKAGNMQIDVVEVVVGILTFTLFSFLSEIVQELVVEKFNSET